MKHWFSKKLSKEDAQELLLKSIKEGHRKKVGEALDAGADIEHIYDRVVINCRGHAIVFHKLSPLLVAILSRKDDIAELLVQNKADPLAACGTPPKSPLHEAASGNMPKAIAAMAAAGANMEADFNDEMPLDCAVSSRSEAALLQLLALGASPNHVAYAPLFYRLYTLDRYETCAQALLDAGAEVVEGSSWEETAKSQNRTLCEFYQAHLQQLDRKLACAPGDGLPEFPLIHEGKPTKELNHICGAGKLQELFSEKRWKGKEPEALALYDRIAPVLLDYYRDKLEAMVDMTAIRRNVLGNEGPSAVKRYVRPPTTPEAGR